MVMGTEKSATRQLLRLARNYLRLEKAGRWINAIEPAVVGFRTVRVTAVLGRFDHGGGRESVLIQDEWQDCWIVSTPAADVIEPGDRIQVEWRLYYRRGRLEEWGRVWFPSTI